MSNVNNPGKSGSGFTTQTDVTGASRLKGTVYRNSGSTPMLVQIIASLAASSQADVYSDAAVSPTVKVGSCSTQAAVTDIATITFLVMPLNY